MKKLGITLGSAFLLIIGFIASVVWGIGISRDIDNLRNKGVEQEQIIVPIDTFFIQDNIAVTATCYYPTIGQTDSSPFITADNSKINKTHPLKHRWIAVSRDLLEVFDYGDTVNVLGTWVYDGKWIIHDTMNKRFKNKIDFLVGKSDYLDKFDDVKIKKI